MIIIWIIRNEEENNIMKIMIMYVRNENEIMWNK